MYERIANKNTEKGINYFSQILRESHLGSLNWWIPSSSTSNTQTFYRRPSARCHETSRTLFSSLLWPLALSSPHLNRRRRCFSHLTQLQSLLATASPAKRIYATALAALAPSDRVVAAMAHLLCYVWLTQNGLPNYPQVEPKLTQKINGSALHGTCTIFYFLGIG